MADAHRQIVIHSDYANGDIEGPYRDARAGDILVSPDKVRVYDGELFDGYLEISHNGIRGEIKSSFGPVNVDGVEVAAHVSRHLGNGEDSIYVVSTRSPLASDDGYAVGMRWLNTVDGYEYACFSNAPGSAIWRISVSGGGGEGITELQHVALRQLIHFIDGGPAEGFASGAYRETTGTVFPTTVIWYNQAGVGKKKIVSKEIIWSGPFPTTITWKMYDVAENLLVTVTDTISYSGPFETSRTRTIT